MRAPFHLLPFFLIPAFSSPSFATTPFLQNLIANPGGETAPAGSSNFDTIIGIPNWTTSGPFNNVRYNATNSDTSVSNSTAINGGTSYFTGGPSNTSSSASQIIDVHDLAAPIDAGVLAANLFADIGGYQNQGDNITVTAYFFDAGSNTLSSFTIGPVTAADRANVTALLPRSGFTLVPPNTRSIKIIMLSTRLSGSDDDGLADNLSLYLTYAGDANLNGKIDADDFALTDRGFQQHLTGWSNGDFNGDNSVNNADYTILNKSFAYQSTAGTPTNILSIPEPATLGLFALFPLIRRSRIANSV